MTKPSNASPLRGVQACLFDAYDTLFDFAAAARKCRDKLGDDIDRLTTSGAKSSCNIPGCGLPRADMRTSGGTRQTLSTFPRKRSAQKPPIFAVK
jgi:hypothetical protein